MSFMIDTVGWTKPGNFQTPPEDPGNCRCHLSIRHPKYPHKSANIFSYINSDFILIMTVALLL